MTKSSSKGHVTYMPHVPQCFNALIRALARKGAPYNVVHWRCRTPATHWFNVAFADGDHNCTYANRHQNHRWARIVPTDARLPARRAPTCLYIDLL